MVPSSTRHDEWSWKDRTSGGVVVLRKDATSDSELYREWQAPPQWRHVVSCLWEQTLTVDRVQQVLPDGHADLLLYDDERLDIVGLHDRLLTANLPAGTHVRGVRLRPEAVGPAFRTRAAELRDLTVPAADVMTARQADALRTDRGLDRWVRAVEPDPRTAAAVDMLATRSLADVSTALGITDRHLRRVVLDAVGVPPKTYQRVVRLQCFLLAAEHGQTIARAAAEAGYADQSHLNLDTRALADHTPGELLAMRGLAA